MSEKFDTAVRAVTDFKQKTNPKWTDSDSDNVIMDEINDVAGRERISGDDAREYVLSQISNAPNLSLFF